MGYRALERLRFGDGFIEPGEPVPDHEPGRSYDQMLALGQIEQTDTPGPEASTPPAPARPAAARPRARRRPPAK